MVTYCPWSGEKDCGCRPPFPGDSLMPFEFNGKIPKRCERVMTVASAEHHKHRVSDALAAEISKWVAAGRPRLSTWYAEPDEDDDTNEDDN